MPTPVDLINNRVWANDKGYIGIGKAKRKFPVGARVKTKRGYGYIEGMYFRPTYAKKRKSECDTQIKVSYPFANTTRPCFFEFASEIEVIYNPKEKPNL